VEQPARVGGAKVPHDKRTDPTVRVAHNPESSGVLTETGCRIKERLRKSFADLANDFEQRLRVISSALAALEGPLEVQQQSVQEIQTRIPAITDALRRVSAAEAECQAANVEENDYTVFTCQDLEFELELVVQSIAKKIAFIDNQVHSPYLVYTVITNTKARSYRGTCRI
jgi:septal ring factor EnvC (AmiA/AmiB activator)